MKILILENNNEYLNVMIKVLKDYGDLSIYSSFGKCIEDVRRFIQDGVKFDLAILDLDIVDGGALQILKVLRSNYDNNKTLEVVLQSEDENVSSIMNLFSMPQDVFFVKTVDEEKFSNNLKCLLKHY